jgi:hypothetical protein
LQSFLLRVIGLTRFASLSKMPVVDTSSIARSSEVCFSAAFVFESDA